MCKTVLNLLEAVYLRFRKIVVERVTVVKFRVDNRGSDNTGCFRSTGTTELTNIIAGYRHHSRARTQLPKLYNTTLHFNNIEQRYF